MLIITRSFVAALVIVGTVALSLGSSFGLSVLIWQYILGIKLYWMVLPMSVIVLLAVGSDYNLLLVSRMKEEIAAGINTGIIRAMGGTGKVVTNAGLVFAFTMASMASSDLLIIGQVGTTIGLGLLFDTLIVRSFMTPTIAALLGRWFWWPQIVRPRPASQMLRSVGTASAGTLFAAAGGARATTRPQPNSQLCPSRWPSPFTQHRIWRRSDGVQICKARWVRHGFIRRRRPDLAHFLVHIRLRLLICDFVLLLGQNMHTCST